MASQCGILFIGARGVDESRVASLRSLGFRVDAAEQLPPSDEMEAYHAVIVHGVTRASLASLGAHLRAKPLFGRRVLIALVTDLVSDRDRRDAMMCGFDQTMPADCPARILAAHILRRLRAYPEYRCLLRAPNGRRKAA